eukprot:5774340-Ditylum_brightwellii.AAC.1
MTTLSQAQLVGGSAFPFLTEVHGNRLYVPSSWLECIPSFLDKCNGKVIIKDIWFPNHQCYEDRVLMDVFAKTVPGDANLVRLYMVRLYLGVMILTNICNDEGTEIKPWGKVDVWSWTTATPYIQQAFYLDLALDKLIHTGGYQLTVYQRNAGQPTLYEPTVPLFNPLPGKYWMTVLNKCHVKIATVGSVAQRKGHFAVMIHTKDETLEFQGLCDCHPDLLSSYRAGILAILYFLNSLSIYTK